MPSWNYHTIHRRGAITEILLNLVISHYFPLLISGTQFEEVTKKTPKYLASSNSSDCDTLLKLKPQDVASLGGMVQHIQHDIGKPFFSHQASTNKTALLLLSKSHNMIIHNKPHSTVCDYGFGKNTFLSPNNLFSCCLTPQVIQGEMLLVFNGLITWATWKKYHPKTGS